MIWILTLCTEAWVMCGVVHHIEYASKADCYEARALLIEDHGREHFKYVVCRPESVEPPAGREVVG